MEIKSKEDGLVVTQEEIDKSGTTLFSRDQLNFMLRKTPEGHVFKRPGKGGGEWKYVTGIYVKKVLNLVFGWDWDFEILDYKFDLDIKQAFVHGRLTVRISNGDKEPRVIKKEQFGRVDIKFKTEWVEKDGKRSKQTTNEPLDIGNDLKAAGTDALKKCASEFGICSDIYGANEFKEIQIIDSDDASKLEMIDKLLLREDLLLTTDDRMHLERIVEEEEEKSYDKALKLLNRAIPKPKK